MFGTSVSQWNMNHIHIYGQEALLDESLQRFLKSNGTAGATGHL